MELFKEHIVYAIVIAVLISGSLEVVKERLAKTFGKELTGGQWFVTSLVVSIVIGFGYTMYYEQLPIKEAVAINLIVVLGPQVFYKAIFEPKTELVYLEGVNDAPKNIDETLKAEGK